MKCWMCMKRGLAKVVSWEWMNSLWLISSIFPTYNTCLLPQKLLHSSLLPMCPDGGMNISSRHSRNKILQLQQKLFWSLHQPLMFNFSFLLHLQVFLFNIENSIHLCSIHPNLVYFIIFAHGIKNIHFELHVDFYLSNSSTFHCIVFQFFCVSSHCSSSTPFNFYKLCLQTISDKSKLKISIQMKRNS